jgi:hypothetical protein
MSRYEFETELNTETPKEISEVRPKKNNWEFSTGYLVLVVVAGLILYTIFFNSSKSGSITNSQVNSNDNSNDVEVNSGSDTYRCSRFSMNERQKLLPNKELYNEIETLENEANSLENFLDRNNPNTTNTDIDFYNRKVREYNNLISEVKNKTSVYNSQVDTYNKYLIDNCTKL